MLQHPLLRKPAVQGILITIGFLLLLIIAVGLFGDSDTTSSSASNMTATVGIYAGSVEVINEDTFPWHGLLITLNDRYSTKYRLGDSNYPFIREDRILEPKDDYQPSLTAFIDKSGNEYPGEVYTIIATKVKLEAKTKVDGPYDLKATFRFSADEDVIVDNAIRRTNKPTADNANPTPYPLQPVELKATTPQPTAIPTQTAEETERWQEQWEHWKNIDAFQALIQEVNVDRIIDKEELDRICFALEQWTEQMTAAKQYVKEYREFNRTRASLPSIHKIEEEADRILELLNQAECLKGGTDAS